MSGQAKPNPAEDSLDRVERLMAMEELLINQIEADSHLDPGQRQRLIREIDAWIERAEFGGGDDDFDDDDFAVLVRKLGPYGPRGQEGAAAAPPEEPSLE